MSFVAIALMVFGFACSSNESPTVEQSSPPSSTPAVSASSEASTKVFTTKTFTLELKQDNDNGKFYFEPSTIKAPKGSTVTVQLSNVGSVEHNFTLTALKINKDVEKGGSTTFTLNLGSEPKYDFYCEYHKDKGMTGSFELG